MREGLSKRTRFEVFKRDGFQCIYCGAHPSETVILEVDHVHPVAEGGKNDMDNLVTACWDCNHGKGAVPLSSVPQSLEEKAIETAEREAQIRSYYKILAAKKRRVDDEMWSVADIFIERFGGDDILRSRLVSIKTFLKQLDVYEVQEAMEKACGYKETQGPAFSYFCGICWNKIKGRSSR